MLAEQRFEIAQQRQTQMNIAPGRLSAAADFALESVLPKNKSNTLLRERLLLDPIEVRRYSCRRGLLRKSGTDLHPDYNCADSIKVSGEDRVPQLVENSGRLCPEKAWAPHSPGSAWPVRLPVADFGTLSVCVVFREVDILVSLLKSGVVVFVWRLPDPKLQVSALGSVRIRFLLHACCHNPDQSCTVHRRPSHRSNYSHSYFRCSVVRRFISLSMLPSNSAFLSKYLISRCLNYSRDNGSTRFPSGAGTGCAKKWPLRIPLLGPKTKA